MSEIEVTGSVTVLGNDDTSHRIGQTEGQAAFVTEWRDRFPELVWSDSWSCPLCGMTIQVNATQDNRRAGELRTLRVGQHKEWHGPDWLAYEQAGAGGAG